MNDATNPRIIHPDAWYSPNSLFTALSIDPSRLEAARAAGVLTGVPVHGPRAQFRPDALLYSGRAIQQWLAAGAPIQKRLA